MNNIKIGGFIRELRKEKNMTQSQIGELLGVGGKSVSKWECGRALPDVNLLLDLSEILDVTVAEILKGEKENNYLNLIHNLLKQSFSNENGYKIVNIPKEELNFNNEENEDKIHALFNCILQYSENLIIILIDNNLSNDALTKRN